MYEINIMYPNNKDIYFDFEYYKKTHMKMVEGYLKPFELLKTKVLKGQVKQGEPPEYACIGVLYFEDIADYYEAIGTIGTVLSDDIPHFTNVVPIRQINKTL